MTRYVLRRLVSAFSVVMVTLLSSFVLFAVAPTDPAGVICGARCPTQRYQAIRDSLSLDRPVIVQFGDYVRGIVAGRAIHTGGTTVTCAAPCLGYSFTLGQPVTTLLAQAVPVTVSIVVGSAVIFLAVGVLTGTFAARRHGTVADRATVGAAVAISSLPHFVVALLVALYVTVLPPPAYHPFLRDPVSWASGMVAAWLTLGVTNAALYTRYTRISMIEVLDEDFIRAARAKGLPERRVVYRHGLRVAAAPIATIFGMDLAFQLTGAIIIESVFGLPGLGMLTLRSFNQYDLPVLMGSILIGAVLLVTMNLVVDIFYTVLDPRVTLA